MKIRRKIETFLTLNKYVVRPSTKMRRSKFVFVKLTSLLERRDQEDDF